MSNTLNTTLGLDISNWVASAKTAGDVTDREFTKMQRLVKALNQNLADMNKYGKEAANSPKALEKTAKELEHVGFASSGAKRELIVLAHELSQGNYSRFGGSLMVLAERTNAAELAFSALGIGVLAATAVVGGFVAAIAMGHHEQTVFNNSLIATGNAAGMTADSFHALAAASAAVAGSTIGHGKESLQDLVATGRIYPEVIGIATQASINLQRVTGQSAEEVAKDFGKMGDDVAKWAMEHNKHMHFVSAAQFKYIKELAEAGKTSEAAAETLKLLNAQVKTQTADIGNLEAGWIKFTQALSAAKDAAMSWGKSTTSQESLQNLASQLGRAQSAPAGSRFYGADGNQVAGRQAAIDSITAEINKQRELVRFQDQAANQKAKSAEIAEKAIAKMMEKPEKSKVNEPTYQALLTDIAKYNSESEIMASTAKKLADYDRWGADMKDRLTKETEKLTAAQLKGIEAAIAAGVAERKHAEQTIFASDASRRATAAIQADFEAQRIAVDAFLLSGDELIASFITQAADAGKTAHQIERLTAMRKLDAEASKAMAGAGPEAIAQIMAEAERKKGELSSAITKKQKGLSFESAADSSIAKYLEGIGDQTKRAESLVTGSFTRMEDAIVNFAKTGKLSFSDLFGFMAEEFIRNQIKMAEKSLLTDASGSFIGIGEMAKGAASFFGIPGFANGLDYVPHDNYPAMLHEGERVLTRQDAANGSARGGINIDGSITIGSVGAGTSRAEVFSAIQQASAQTRASIMRTLKQQGVTA